MLFHSFLGNVLNACGAQVLFKYFGKIAQTDVKGNCDLIYTEVFVPNILFYQFYDSATKSSTAFFCFPGIRIIAASIDAESSR